MKTTNINIRTICLAMAFLLAIAVSSIAQTQTPAPQTSTQDTSATQTTQAPNLQSELGLSPDQIQKWRALNREFRQQEVAGNMKVKEARRALADAMESASPNEEVIKQRAKELADAQSEMTQLNALRQARVLQMLTPEQRIKLKEIRQRNQAAKRGIQQQNPNAVGQQQQLPRRANVQMLPPAQRKALRQQQRSKPKP